MDYQSEQLLNQYLDDVERELSDISPSLRRDFVAEIRSHFVEEWNHTAGGSPSEMRNILERFGDAREIAAEFREKHNLAEKRQIPTTQPFPPVLIIILTIFLWPVGIILAWLSPSWETRHKVVATVLPVFMLLLLPMAAIGAYTTSVESVSYVQEVDISNGYSESPVGGAEGPERIYVEQSRETGPSRLLSIVGFIVAGTLVLIGNPLGSGIYLAITKDPAH
ncbi:HAAS signaling domain-containing protein [Dethiobacter alkaliphilus]|uniref:HAAS signaling domain-containing protein n=1 Tax=Dethiobacter alkaliphilus TaxID=427926 RepID=UPI0022266D29|nr:hypothetical protein [Dethiobacter alkaliphilus]MCW3490351.1 hypothetical protein [Dethiobacter alkaliphilus]